MARRPLFSPFLFPFAGAALDRAAADIGRATLRAGTRLLQEAAKRKTVQRRTAAGSGEWIAGIAFGPAGSRRYRLFRPAGVAASERLPLVVMLHGCGQDAASFAASTRMNRIATRQRFLAVYPEQERAANPNGCWNWFDTRSGRAHAEAATIRAVIDQVLLLYPADRARVAVAGLSAGASMAALLATRMPERLQAVVMHSGIAPGTAHSTVSALTAMQGWRAPGMLPADTPLPPLLVIHGSRDTVVSVANARAAALAWAEGCGGLEGESRLVRRGKRHAMTVTDFKVRRRTVATLCEIDGLAHAWSGGDAKQPYGDAVGPDASRLAWAFIARQFA
jgi:poly(hydroxyalkanoate) depolymerase family esterase